MIKSYAFVYNSYSIRLQLYILHHFHSFLILILTLKCLHLNYILFNFWNNDTYRGQVLETDTLNNKFAIWVNNVTKILSVVSLFFQ